MNRYNIFNRECGCIYWGSTLKVYDCSNAEWGFWSMPVDQRDLLTPASDTDADDVINAFIEMSHWAYRGKTIADAINLLSLPLPEPKNKPK